MSDLGCRNGGSLNSMKLGEDIDLDELLLKQFYLFSFCLPFNFSGGVLFLGYQSTKIHPYESFEYHYNKCRKLTEYIMV